ncbi:MAG: lysoplasmalogenase [Clostridia bacterium]|nr:lysoplasmalogenase [Clostridia bacterium]
MSVPYIIGFIVLFVLQLISTCVFLKVEIPRPSKKSLVLKLTCSTIFLLTAVLSMFCSKNFTSYAVFILIGLSLSWIGDGVLHYKTTENNFIAGVLIFLCGHISYIVAFLKAQALYFPEAPFLGYEETVLLLGGVCFGQCRLHMLKADYGKAFIPCTLYMNVIMVMFVKAMSLSIRFIMQSPVENAVVTGIILAVGVCMFDVSDFTLALLHFTPRYSKSYGMRRLNVWTYFFAQMCLGLSILNIAV